MNKESLIRSLETDHEPGALLQVGKGPPRGRGSICFLITFEVQLLPGLFLEHGELSAQT